MSRDFLEPGKRRSSAAGAAPLVPQGISLMTR